MIAKRAVGPGLSVSGECPGEISISVSGASGNASIALLGSASEGAAAVPAGRPCEGTGLGIEAPTLLTTFSTGPLGNHTIERTVSEGSCGLYLQAVDLAACVATTVEPVPNE